jgi:hypothetical protein
MDTRCLQDPLWVRQGLHWADGPFSRHQIKEHQWHIRLEHPDKLAVAEHSIDQGHCIQLHNSSILATKTRYSDRIAREAIEIELHPYSFNREGGFYLSKSWKLLICSLKLYMTLEHLMTWFHNHNVFTNNPALPFPPKLGTSLCTLVSYKPTPLPAIPLLSASSIWIPYQLPFSRCISSQHVGC